MGEMLAAAIEPTKRGRRTYTRCEPRSALTPVMSIRSPDPAVFTELYGIAGFQ
jgi:hypothetical protein